MAQASLSPFNNNWTNVHDFTPNNGEGGTSHNFSLITDELATAKVGLNDPEVIGETDLLASFDPSVSLVPFTTGSGPGSDPGEVLYDRKSCDPTATLNFPFVVFVGLFGDRVRNGEREE